MQVSDAGRLMSIEVHSAEGESLGRVGAVYVPEGLRQPLLVAFPDDSSTPFVAPLFGAELTAEGLRLSYSAERVTSGPTVEADATLSVGVISWVITYYGRQVAVDRPLTDGVGGVGDVSATFADVRIVPRIAQIGDDDLPPIVVTRPALSD
jgi:hypothetical protein